MNEREVVAAYIDEALPDDIVVYTVPIKPDGYGGIQIELPSQGEPPPYVPGQQTVDIKLNHYSDLRSGLWAGYSGEMKRLIVGVWIE